MHSLIGDMPTQSESMLEDGEVHHRLQIGCNGVKAGWISQTFTFERNTTVSSGYDDVLKSERSSS